MSLPLFRFTLTHQPKLPVFGPEWETESGSQPWSLDATPSVSLTAGTQSSILTDTIFLPGTYEVEYSLTITGASNATFTLVFDKASHTVFVSSGGDTGLLSGAGTFTGTLTIVITEASTGAEIAFANLSAGSKLCEINSLKITNTTGHQISEPIGWKNIILKMERHPEFHSLVEYFEGSFVFYGSNGIQDGGIEFLKSVDRTYGFRAVVRFKAEVSFNDGGSYEEVFDGLVSLANLQEMSYNHTMEVPVIRDDIWTKFIAHRNTPVDLSSTTDLYGNTISPVEPIDINLTTQKIQKQFYGIYDFPAWIGISAAGGYIQTTPDKIELDEIKERIGGFYTAFNPALPSWCFGMSEAGGYTFDIRIIMSGAAIDTSAPADPTLQAIAALWDWKLQHNDTVYTFNKTDVTGGAQDFTEYTLNVSLAIGVNDTIRIYGDEISNVYNQLTIWGVRGANFLYTPPTPDEYPILPNTTGHDIPSYIRVTADTVYPSTEAKGYFLHDVFAGIIERICGKNIFYSEILGRTDTNMRQYVSNGCFSPFVVIKGLQLRGYTLEEKPFFISFNDAWNGANPIFNLGLGYDTVSSEYVIRLEEKAHFYDIDNVAVNLSNASPIREYDQGQIIKTIDIGYEKWESEDLSGIDDPQTRHMYATGASQGEDVTLLSKFIAASISIEVTRRKGRIKDADYKYDNSNFIIALNDTTVSPDRYQPATDEDFDSISGLLNSDTRYNTILSPLRNFLRWANYFGGCMQKYTTSSYKFQSGEGNYDMVSDYSFALGSSCLGIIADPITESQDIPLGAPSNYNTVFGYIHLPNLLTVDQIDLMWEDYKASRDNREFATALSQTDTNHHKFFIKEMSYHICFGKAKFTLWDSGQ